MTEQATLNPATQLPKPDPTKKAPAPALMGTLRESQFEIREYTVRIPVAHTPRDLMEAGYWMHHASKLRINDKIDCISETGMWECTLRVVNKGDNWAKMRMISAYEAKGDSEAAPPLRDAYKTDFVPSKGHRVIHKDSARVISEGHQTKDAAIKALEDHVAELARKQ